MALKPEFQCILKLEKVFVKLCLSLKNAKVEKGEYNTQSKFYRTGPKLNQVICTWALKCMLNVEILAMLNVEILPQMLALRLTTRKVL